MQNIYKETIKEIIDIYGLLSIMVQLPIKNLRFLS